MLLGSAAGAEPASRVSSLRSRCAALLLVVTLLVAGCQYDQRWTFALTRATSDSDFMGDALEWTDGSVDMFLVVLALCCVPVALDVVLLPVTLTRDAIVCK